MRAAVLLMIVQLGGCAQLLGIENPSTGGDGGTPIDGALSRDAGNSPGEHLAISTGDFQIASLQVVRFHVLHVLPAGTMQDVTLTATLVSDDPGVASIAGPGLVFGGAQAGTTMIHASFGSALTTAVKATVTSAMCHPVINELATGSAISPADEWVEIYNPCTNGISVDGWTLDYRAKDTVGAVDTNLMVTLAGTMLSGELRLYAGADYTGAKDGTWPGDSGLLQQTSAAVGLRAGAKDTGPLVDAIAYGPVTPGNPFIESSPTMAMANGLSASRLPFDGRDDDNNLTDVAVIMTQTPRAPNAP